MRTFAFMLLIATGAACADEIDADALSLADKAPDLTQRASDWRAFVEVAAGESTLRTGSTPTHMQRFSLDMQYDKSIAPGWRATIADRLDLTWQRKLADENSINTLKEAYLSWQAQENLLVDAGRVNVRYGVASGYNPTDFFRAGAIRSVVSTDPNSLRKNRLGSVMLRGQTLWAGGSLTALYSPKLADQPNNSAFNPDIGATNHQDRWLLSASHQLSDSLNPQLLVYGATHQSPQFGFNLTTLVNDATVAYVEWSGGRSRSQLSQALNTTDDSAFRNRIASGLTYATEKKISLTLEYEYNGGGLDQMNWQALQRGSPATYWRYRQSLQSAQDLPTKQAAFLYGTWQDALVIHLDVTAMMRVDAVDHSRMSWLEMRYHRDRADLALQWQLNSGRAGSEYGALPQRRNLQAQVTYYF